MTPITYSKRAFKYVKELQPKQAKQILLGIAALSLDPMPQDCRQLSGYPGFFRLTLGEHRAIFERVDGIIEIKVIGARNDDDVYREFKKIV
jgi:mRNA interferase RelE/StbE